MGHERPTGQELWSELAGSLRRNCHTDDMPPVSGSAASSPGQEDASGAQQKSGKALLVALPLELDR
jgi:hypothetical protein